MHDCSPLGALVCSNCSYFWCSKWAYGAYFANIIYSLDNVTIIRRDRCVSRITCRNCKEPFNLLDIDKLEFIRSWGNSLIDSVDTKPEA